MWFKFRVSVRVRVRIQSEPHTVAPILNPTLILTISYVIKKAKSECESEGENSECASLSLPLSL